MWRLVGPVCARGRAVWPTDRGPPTPRICVEAASASPDPSTRTRSADGTAERDLELTSTSLGGPGSSVDEPEDSALVSLGELGDDPQVAPEALLFWRLTGRLDARRSLEAEQLIRGDAQDAAEFEEVSRVTVS